MAKSSMVIGRLIKKNVSYANDGILFSFIKEENTVVCYSRVKSEDPTLTEICHSQKAILHDFTYMKYLK